MRHLLSEIMMGGIMVCVWGSKHKQEAAAAAQDYRKMQIACSTDLPMRTVYGVWVCVGCF